MIFGRLLSILGFVFGTKATRKIVVDHYAAGKPKQTHGQDYGTIINIFVNMLFDVVNTPELVHVTSFYVLQAATGLISVMREVRLPDFLTIDALFFILFKLALPNFLKSTHDDFREIMAAYKGLGEANHVQTVLFGVVQLDPMKDVFSYEESSNIQLQVLLDRVTDQCLNLFSFTNNFESFVVLQNFLRSILDQIRRWKQGQLQNRMQMHDQDFFVRNMIDILQWNFNCQNSIAKRHLVMHNGHESFQERF